MMLGGRVRFTAAGRALKHRNFRLFFFGQLISVTGTWMQTLALGWLLGTLVGWDKAVVYIGLLGVVQFMPVLALGLFGGIIADIWPKRKTVIATQTAAGLLALVLGGLVYFQVVVVWHVFVLAFLLGLVNAVDMPARQSFVVEMVGGDDVANAVALNSAVFNGARIVGPAVAGILIGVVGTALCFVLNGLSYGAVVIGLVAMRDNELKPAARLAMPRSLNAVGANLSEGLRYVWHTPIVLLAISVIGFVSTFGMNFNVVLPVMAANVLKVGSNGYGLLFTAMGAGALTSALAVATLQRPRVRVLLGGGMVLGVAELVLASTTSFPIALAAVFFAGVGAIATAASANSLVQITVPGPLRGRVMSVYTTVFAGSTPVGNGLTGGVGGLWGTPAALVMNGAVAFGAEAIAAVAVLRGRVPRVGAGASAGAGVTAGVAAGVPRPE
ncbi:MAG: MFS transporter [Candidatus Limnocylindrales bacterium]|jgi:MFS family permease